MSGLYNILLFFHFLIVSIIVIFILFQKSNEDNILIENTRKNNMSVDGSIVNFTKYLIILFLANCIGMLYVKNKIIHTNKVSDIKKILEEKNDSSANSSSKLSEYDVPK